MVKYTKNLFYSLLWHSRAGRAQGAGAGTKFFQNWLDYFPSTWLSISRLFFFTVHGEYYAHYPFVAPYLESHHKPFRRACLQPDSGFQRPKMRAKNFPHFTKTCSCYLDPISYFFFRVAIPPLIQGHQDTWTSLLLQFVHFEFEESNNLLYFTPSFVTF